MDDDTAGMAVVTECSTGAMARRLRAAVERRLGRLELKDDEAGDERAFATLWKMLEQLVALERRLADAVRAEVRDMDAMRRELAARIRRLRTAGSAAMAAVAA